MSGIACMKNVLMYDPSGVSEIKVRPLKPMLKSGFFKWIIPINNANSLKSEEAPSIPGI